MHNHGLARLRFLFPAAVPLLVGALLLAGCGSDVKPSNPRTASSKGSGSVVLIGTDTPAAVVSFTTVLQSVDATDADGRSISLISGTPTVEFVNCKGLPTVLEMNDAPAGTYTQIAVTFGPATIGYLPAHSGAAPSLQTMPAVFTTSTVTARLPAPLVVTQGVAVSIRVDFPLDQSMQVDSSGNVTGQVGPILDVKLLEPAIPAKR